MNRDSVLWVLGIAAAVLTYLGAAPSPVEWSYAEWIQAAAFCVATIAGKLSSSPLAGKTDPDTVRPRSEWDEL